jgi:hypothetical protein
MSFRAADENYKLTDEVIEALEYVGDLKEEALPIIKRYLLFAKDRYATLHPVDKLSYFIMTQIVDRIEPKSFMDPELIHANKALG